MSFSAFSRFLWDAAYATFNGVSDGKSVGGEGGGVCRKRDNDFADGVPRRGGGVGVFARPFSILSIGFGTSKRSVLPWKRSYFVFGEKEREKLLCTLRSLRFQSGMSSSSSSSWCQGCGGRSARTVRIVI